MLDGYGRTCKTCMKIRYKEYYKTHKADYDRRCREWQAANPDKVKESAIKSKLKYKESGRERRNANKREWTAANREKVRQLGRNFYKENAEDLKRRVKDWRNKNIAKANSYCKKWRQENPGKSNAKTARRRAAQLQATPPWLTDEHKKQIEEFYVKAAELTVSTGIPHEVDHIMPLQGKNGRGLHVPWNLQILSQKENAKKNNKVLDNLDIICYDVNTNKENE